MPVTIPKTLVKFYKTLNAKHTRFYAGCFLMDVECSSLIESLGNLTDYRPHFQRSINSGRINKLYDEQKQEFLDYGGYGIATTPIVLGHCKSPIYHGEIEHENSDQTYIVDGFHRVHVLARLLVSNPESMVNVRVPLRIYLADDMEIMRQYYLKININQEAHTTYDLDSFVNEVVNGIYVWFQETYDSELFSDCPTGTPKRPRIHRQKLFQNLKNSASLLEIIENSRLDMTPQQCIEDICAKFASHNEVLRKRPASRFQVGDSDEESDICLKAQKKCADSKNPIYFGMYSHYGWIDDSLKMKSEEDKSKQKHKKKKTDDCASAAPAAPAANKGPIRVHMKTASKEVPTEEKRHTLPGQKFQSTQRVEFAKGAVVHKTPEFPPPVTTQMTDEEDVDSSSDEKLFTDDEVDTHS